MKMKNKQDLSKKVIVFWEKLNYWQKGTIIGFLIGALFFVIVCTLKYFSFDISSGYASFFFLFLDLAGRFFFLNLANICEFEKGSLCETSLPYFIIPVTYMLFGFIIGLILSYINKKYQLNKLSKRKYYALLGFVIISFLIIVDFIMFFPLSMYSLIFRFAFLAYPVILGVFTSYFYMLGWAYEFMKKRKWWNLKGKAIYCTIFAILFIIMWAHVSILMIFAFVPLA